MVVVACAGFPVPVSRYWGDFSAVEIPDTELGIPGEGTLRRWIRESPKGFAFTVLAPKDVAASGFAKTKENKAHVVAISEFAKKLGALAVVFVAEDTFKPTKITKAAITDFVTSLPKDFPNAVLDLPAWKPSQIAEAIGKGRAIPAVDPLGSDATLNGKKLVYLRLPGPAGKRSRYDEDALKEIAERCRSSRAETTFCVFRNVDMHTNATALIKLLG